MNGASVSRAPTVRIHRSLTKALRLFDADRLRWADEAAALGPLVALRMGPINVWIITDADVARTVLVSDGGSWIRPPATLAPIRVGVGENLFTQSDKNWAKVQPFVAPAFRRKALEPRLAAIDAVIDDETEAIPLDTDDRPRTRHGPDRTAPRGVGAARRGARPGAGGRDRAASTRGRRLGRHASRTAHRLPAVRARVRPDAR